MTHVWKRRIGFLGLLCTFMLFLLYGFEEHFLFYANLGAICILFLCWNQYDKRSPRLSELVLCACMITMAVAGRVLFLWAPGFKPLTGIDIIAGALLGGWNGFLCGSLSALLSDLFFGIGPWTFFQMLAWGIIGLGAGFIHKCFKKRTIRIVYALFSGVFFSVFMDIYSTMAAGSFDFQRYIALLITSLPFMVIYMISNVLFVEILYPIMHKKIERIRLKYDL